MRDRARAGSSLLVALVLVSAAACTDGSTDRADTSTSSVASSGGSSSSDPTPNEPRLLCTDLAVPEVESAPAGADPLVGSLESLVPLPSEVAAVDGHFLVDSDVELVVASPEAERSACLLRDELARSTGHVLDVVSVASGIEPEPGQVRFVASTAGDSESAGPTHPEGYRLNVSKDSVVIEASTGVGHGWAVQTLLQSAAPGVESPFMAERPISFPAGTVTDSPRYPWRGLMVDIVRHWFGVTDLERVVDLMASYKLNVLHLHLSDDQGWRIAIDAYPALTEVGAGSEVGGGEGGFLTKDDYRHLVDYADRRGITVVPEIDMPGHTNAALLAVPELNCDGVAPEPYTGTQVGFSSLCIGDPDVDRLVRTVLAELAEMTPGPYIHIGGDEAHSTTSVDYEAFVSQTLDLVRDLGKVPIGWEEVGRAPGEGDLVVQHWLRPGAAEAAVANGASVVLSPSSVLYFDMAYGPWNTSGNSWAGTTDTREVYEWEPSAHLEVEPGAVLGVEAALWTELVETTDEISLRLLPRLPALAEVAWSSVERRDWDGFRERVGEHRQRWAAGGRVHVDDPALDET